MRLIDADGLKPLRGVAIYATDEKTDTKIITASVYRREDIDNAPTIEAIPVEWLRKYVDEHDEIVEEGLYWIVEGIIEDWEEENEEGK